MHTPLTQILHLVIAAPQWSTTRSQCDYYPTICISRSTCERLHINVLYTFTLAVLLTNNAYERTAQPLMLSVQKELLDPRKDRQIWLLFTFHQSPPSYIQN
ncbi:PREDICTED: uncharacterized protein LOC105365216 [Ceratosolen solmsi marchali]|uniref:Uncharacterized protein LOC105365216 n=1 Tax=Ceratosolen solmsi marchali TaxID=326594 RepID=A0AAJ6YP57_9HYME|nr:PREDICTED: uncharacterized protein LOC105365216 [Ceratosolen solmsi marchali]